MYVCLCNAFNQRGVRQALVLGVRTVSDVYRFLGHHPQCGKCAPEIVAMLKEYREREAAAGPPSAVAAD